MKISDVEVKAAVLAYNESYSPEKLAWPAGMRAALKAALRVRKKRKREREMARELSS